MGCGELGSDPSLAQKSRPTNSNLHLLVPDPYPDPDRSVKLKDGQLKPQPVAVGLRLRGCTRPSYSISHHKTWIWFWRMFGLTSSLMVETSTSSLSMTVSSLSSYKVFYFLALPILSCFYTQIKSIFLVFWDSDSGQGSPVSVRGRDGGTKNSLSGIGDKKNSGIKDGNTKPRPAPPHCHPYI